MKKRNCKSPVTPLPKNHVGFYVRPFLFFCATDHGGIQLVLPPMSINDDRCFSRASPEAQCRHDVLQNTVPCSPDGVTKRQRVFFLCDSCCRTGFYAVLRGAVKGANSSKRSWTEFMRKQDELQRAKTNFNRSGVKDPQATWEWTPLLSERVGRKKMHVRRTYLSPRIVGCRNCEPKISQGKSQGRAPDTS